MRAVVQRVKEAHVLIDGMIHASISQGYLVYLGIHMSDDMNKVMKLADKVHSLRIFEDEQGKMNENLAAVDGGILVISQFTLYGNAIGNNRPSFIEAARPEHAIPLYEAFIKRLSLHHPTKSGIFGSHMMVSSINDGPVTIQIEL